MIGTILGAVYKLPIGTCDGRVIWSLKGFIDGAVDGKCLCLCCCIGYVHMQDWEFWQQEFVFMFVLLYRVCTHVRMVNLPTGVCIYFCVGVEGMYTCKTGHFGIKSLCLC